MRLNTVFLLMAEYETPHIPLEDVCKKYLGMEYRQACRLATVQKLPIPAFRTGSQKSPWLVNIEDLAKYLDQMNAEARKVWSAMADASRPLA